MTPFSRRTSTTLPPPGARSLCTAGVGATRTGSSPAWSATAPAVSGRMANCRIISEVLQCH